MFLRTNFFHSLWSDFDWDDYRKITPRPPLLCYQCSSDPTSNHVPVLPYHENCAGGEPIPSHLAIPCELDIPPANVVTPFDTVELADRDNYIKYLRSEKYSVECAKFYDSRSKTTRKGCALMHEVDSKNLKGKEPRFVKGFVIMGNYCFESHCNHGNEVKVASLLGIFGVTFVSQILWVVLMQGFS